ncbi:MAG: nucleotide exchange factor GrpE [Firmicutes bacterium]|nr:nucleotide exchange factor GrpE [Bacillota bacterium]
MSDKNLGTEKVKEVTSETDQAQNEEETVLEKEEICSCAEKLEKENAKLVNQLLRLKADFENFRRRSKGQMEDLVSGANENLLQDLLPVLDDFQRALSAQAEACSEEDPFYQGVQMVHQSLERVLRTYGLKSIKAEGEPFDPNFHEAVSMTGEGGDTLVVLKETQTGYLLNGKVIRHAKVLVGQSEEEE